MSGEISTRTVFADAMELIGSGHADRAESVVRDALEARPEDVNLLGLLGAILVKSNRLADAERTLRRTTELAPTFAKPHHDLGYALLVQGRVDEAVQTLETAVRLDPSDASTHLQLGRALAAAGRGREADQAFERAFDLDPVKKQMALAAEHHKAGRLEEAEQGYRRVLADDPKNVDALRLLGRIALAAGRARDAERLFRRALGHAPDFVAAHMDLGRLLKDQHQLEDAITCFRRAVELEPDHVQAHFQLAAALAAARTHDALTEYQRVVELRPDHAGAWLGLGHVLKTVGRQREAIEAYRECIRIRPDNGESYWSLANLKTYPLNAADIEAMQGLLERDEGSEQSQVNLKFALAKAFEDAGDYEQAWAYYRSGNGQQRMLESYDPVATESANDAIVKVFDQAFLESKAGLGDPDPAPIFVVGLPRSGSTLIEQILASHSQVEGTSELPYVGRVVSSLNRNRADGINYPEAVRELASTHLKSLGADYLRLAALHRVEGRARFIDKMPNNFPSVGCLALILPNATIIDARRHPLDACVGGYRQLFARGQAFTYDLTDIGEYWLQYERMMNHWHAVLPGKVLTVQHEELVTDFEAQVRRLLDHCGLPWEDACLRFHETERPIRTASSEQVRQPVTARAIGSWRRYEAHIEELLEILAPALPRYAGYDPGAADPSVHAPSSFV